MAEVKSGRADAFVERPDPDFRVFLIYGPDQGLVSERADRLCSRLGIDLSDPFSVIRLDADTAAADRSRLVDEAGTIGMFGGTRLIRVSGSTRRNLADAVKPLLDSPPVDSRVVIEAGDLKKDSPLRKAVEKAAGAVAIACYPDDDAALERLIDAELSASGQTISRDGRALLRAHLGADRRASRNEIAKLALYCLGRDRVETEDVRAVIGDVSIFAVEDMIDAAIVGDVPALEALLGRLAASGASPDQTLVFALRHFQLLQLARHRMDAAGASADSAAGAMRPTLHFKRRDAFVRALGLWRAEQIAKALARLDQAAFEARANAGLGHALAGTALLALALEAGRSRRR